MTPGAASQSMPSQHKHPPISLRLPEADRAWLLAYVRATGIPRNQVLIDALAVFRAQLAIHISEHQEAADQSPP